MIVPALTVEEGLTVLTPLIYYIIGVVVYSIFIFKLYKFIARKDIFELDLNQYNTASHPGLKKFFRSIFYVIQYALIFPIFTFFWFGVFTALLTFLAKDQTIGTIMLVSITVIAAIRITAYYNEDLSNDLAKMLPFALLDIFLVNAEYFTFGEAYELLKQVPVHLNSVLYYLIFTIALEFILRIMHFIFGKKEEKESV